MQGREGHKMFPIKTKMNSGSDSGLQIAGRLLSTKGSVTAQTHHSLLPLCALHPECILCGAETPEWETGGPGDIIQSYYPK